MCSFYCHQNNREKICPSPILSVLHTITIGTILNFNGGNNGHKLKTLHVNRTLWKNVSQMNDELHRNSHNTTSQLIFYRLPMKWRRLCFLSYLSVTLSKGGPGPAPPWAPLQTCLNIFNLSLVVQGPVRLDMFKVVHYEAQTVWKAGGWHSDWNAFLFRLIFR